MSLTLHTHYLLASRSFLFSRKNRFKRNQGITGKYKIQRLRHLYRLGLGNDCTLVQYTTILFLIKTFSANELLLLTSISGKIMNE